MAGRALKRARVDAVRSPPLLECKFADNSDPLRGIIAANSDPF